MIKNVVDSLWLNLKKIMRSKYRGLFIALIVYLIFFAVSHLYSPWSKLLDEAHTVYDTSNVKHNFIFVRSVFYGISDMLDLMLWGYPSIEVILLGAIALSIKDVIKEQLLNFKAKLVVSNSYDNSSLNSTPLGKAADFFISDFLLDNILVYICTVLVYMYFVHVDYIDTVGMHILNVASDAIYSIQNSGTIAGFLLSIVMLIAFILIMAAVLFFPALYAFPNLVKLCLYTGAIFVYGKAFGVMRADGFLSNAFFVFIASCATILVINMTADFVADRISENMYTLDGIKRIFQEIWDFIYLGTPDLPLRFLILLGASIGAVFIDIGLITLIMVFLSL